MSQRLIYLLILSSISLCSSCLVLGENPPELYYLSEGQSIKVEGTEFEGKKLVAEEIELADDQGELEIEGLLSNLDRRGGTFLVAIVLVRVNDRTKFENGLREPRSFVDLANGIRVKVKVRQLDGQVIEAREVRLYNDSKDTDFEVAGPIESLNLDTSELSLLSMNIKVTPKTRFPEINALREARYSDEIRETRRIRRDDDEPDVAPVRIGNVYLGGKVGFAHEGTRNLHLDYEERDSADWLRPAAQLEVSAPLGEYSEAYTTINFGHQFNFEDGSNRGDRLKLNIKEAFFYLGHFLHPSVALQVGRQRFRDRREWLYDDRLDALRVHVKQSDLKMELAVAKTVFGATGSRSDQLYLIGWTEYRFPGRRYLAGYVLKRNDLTSRDEDPIWFGLSSRGRVTGNLQYWTEMSRLMGRRGQNLLRGYGYDVGTSYRFPISLQPTISLGYAFGSGDKDGSDGVDGNFRQTRLNDNSYRFNGLKRYRYYGVLSEPELFNLKIINLDFGLRHHTTWSLNFAYHHYRQAVPSKKVGDMELDRRPGGRNAEFGKEYDLVFAFRKGRRFDVSVSLGVFVPGPAFEGNTVPAFLFRQVFQYYF